MELPASDSGGVAVDVHGQDKRGGRSFSWVSVDAATGAVDEVEVARPELMRRFPLPVRDLRLLDPLLVYPSSVLSRERAILCNLEQVRCIITADEVLIFQDRDRDVAPRYAAELQMRLAVDRAHGLPFEFIALQVALEAACSFLDEQATELELESYPLLDELTKKLNILNLERVRHVKSRLLSVTRRVEKVRDEIEHLMEDDGGMGEMYLTEKKRRVEASVVDEQALPGSSHCAPVSPVLPPPASPRHNNFKSLLGSRDVVRGSKEEVELMLEAHFLAIDNTLNKLASLKDYIDDTQDFISCNLDNVRNQLIKFELLMNTATFVTSILGVVLGIFGMNFEEPLFKVPHAFEWTLTITVVCGLVIFCFTVWYFKKRGFFPF